MLQGLLMYKKMAQKILEKFPSQSYPILEWKQEESDRLSLTVSLICKRRKGVSTFFFTMVTRWLIPGKSLESTMQFAYRMGDYAVCEIVVLVESTQDLALARRNFPFLEREILLGASSKYHAERIIEMKGLSPDEKTACIQEKITSFVRRFPSLFDFDIFNDMQHFLITSGESFKSVHSSMELARIIFTLYHFRKTLEAKVAPGKAKRFIHVKMRKTRLQTPFGQKEVLSLYLGMNFLGEHEVFDERHLLGALSHFVPGVQSIPHSFYAYEGSIYSCYLEVEKPGVFTCDEIQKIRRGLASEIRGRIKHLVPPIFMPRNEEEVMRSIVALSKQVQMVKDIPQMSISFDEQSPTELAFTVIIVRILLPGSLTIREIFQQSPLGQNLSIDRVKLVGQIRRKYPKEAAVLRIRLPSERFIRGDFSVDLFQARMELVREMESALGPVRDYNGGMIAKQSENFHQLKALLGATASKHTLLLQNFFHSIFPAQMSATLDPRLLQVLFSLLVSTVENLGESILFQSKKANDALFVMAKFQDFSWKQKIFNRIETLAIPSNELATVPMQIYESHFLGFLYLNPSQKKQEEFLDCIPEALACFIESGVD